MGETQKTREPRALILKFDENSNESQKFFLNMELQQISKELPRKKLFILSIFWVFVEAIILVAYFLIPNWKNWFPWMQVLNLTPFLVAIFATRKIFWRKKIKGDIKSSFIITAFALILTYHSAVANLEFSKHQPFFYYPLVHVGPWVTVLCFGCLCGCCDECCNPEKYNPYLAR